MSERNAITEFLIEVWNDDVNGLDDDEATITIGLECIDNQRQCIDNWIDALLELYEIPTRGTYAQLPEQIINIALGDLDYDALANVILSDAWEAMTRVDDAVMHLVDGSRGIYSGQFLVENWCDNLLAEDEALDIVVAGPSDDSPEREHQAFRDIMDAGMFMDGYDYNLYSGDGIYAVRSDLAALLPDGWPG